MQSVVVALLAMVLMGVGMASSADNSGKKLIEYGWDCPDTAYYREHLKDIERSGFDGVVIRIRRPGVEGSLSRRIFSSVPVDAEACEMAIKDLQVSPSPILTENMIQCVTQPGDVDWFDPAWETVSRNAALLAKIAKQGGCRGIMMDPEEYGGYKLWSYKSLPAELKAKHTFAEYRVQVRKRGREFIQAINREYPDITILLLLGGSFTQLKCVRQPRETASYSLLADFQDGLCEGAAPGTVIVDGYEQSYGYRRRVSFERARDVILKDTLRISAVPEAYRAHLRVGFGVCMDHWMGGAEWNLKDFSKNYFTPAEFRNSLASALDLSDRYVWVWTGAPRWWTGENLPKEYVRALQLSKKGPDTQTAERDFPYRAPKASNIPGYSDEETFARFRRTLDELADLPKTGWRFGRDPEEQGQSDGWYLPGFDDSKWPAISIGDFWENEGQYYDGVAWYRRVVNLPQLPAGKHLYLVVGAADESAMVYVNGRYVGYHDIGEGGWDQPFRIDVTRDVKPGPNLLAIRVLDTWGPGGLWKAIKLMAEK